MQRWSLVSHCALFASEMRKCESWEGFYFSVGFSNFEWLWRVMNILLLKHKKQYPLCPSNEYTHLNTVWLFGGKAAGEVEVQFLRGPEPGAMLCHIPFPEPQCGRPWVSRPGTRGSLCLGCPGVAQ